MTALAIAALVACLFLTPLGLPGNWFMIAILTAGVYFEVVSPLTMLACLFIATAAEAVEYLLVQKLNLRYGGSRRAFWGAIAGGIVGVMIGVPIPIVGSVIAGFLGTFLGAAAVTLHETRSHQAATRVGWGVFLARMWAAAVKTAAGVVIVVLGAASFLL